MKQNFTKNQKIIIAISISLIIVSGFVNFSNIVPSDDLRNWIVMSLNVGVVGILIWSFKISAEKTNQIFQYYFTAFPAIVALILIVIIRVLRQYPEIKIDPLFEVGLWFVVLSTIAAIYVMRFSDVRLKRLENAVFSNKEIPTNNEDKSKNTKWTLEKAASLATIIGVAIGLFLGIPPLLSIQSDIDATQKQLNQTNIVISKLGELVENNNRQLESLNKTVTEIHHQTLVQAYVSGGRFNLDTYFCSKPVLENNNTQIFFQPVMLDKDGNPSPIPFYVYFYFDVDGIIKEQPNYKNLDSIWIQQYLLDPPKRESVWLNLTKSIAEARKQNINEIQIVLTSHSFAPYSAVKGQLIREYEQVHEGRVFLELNLIDNQWDFKDPQNSMCFNAMRK